MTYEPDEQDELIGDAMAVGGPAFVEEVHYRAMEAAEAVYPWDGNGAEPAAYRRAWLGEARQLVAERRAELTAALETGANAARKTLPSGQALPEADAVSPCRRVHGGFDSDGMS